MKAARLAGALALVAALAAYSGPIQVEPQAAARKQVVLYATDWCGYCKQARAFLAKHNVRYTEVDIEKSPEGKRDYDRIGLRGVPILVIDGQSLKGFDPGRVAAALNR